MKNLSFNQQIKLQEEMQSKGLNLVTCCNCDAIIIHTHEQGDKDVECYSCKEIININDCSDYFYNGMPEQENEEQQQIPITYATIQRRIGWSRFAEETNRNVYAIKEHGDYPPNEVFYITEGQAKKLNL